MIWKERDYDHTNINIIDFYIYMNQKRGNLKDSTTLTFGGGLDRRRC